MEATTYSGQLNRRVGIYTKEVTRTTTGESSLVARFLFKRNAQRMDAGAQEDKDGQLVPFVTCVFRVRFDAVIMANASALVIRDFDGDFNVQGVQLTDSRRRYLDLKAVKRGEKYTL